MSDDYGALNPDELWGPDDDLEVPVSDPARGNWAVTTTDDCYGRPGGSTPGSWCVYDADEDDPPIADRMTRADAEMVCRALHVAAGRTEVTF